MHLIAMSDNRRAGTTDPLQESMLRQAPSAAAAAAPAGATCLQHVGLVGQPSIVAEVVSGAGLLSLPAEYVLLDSLHQ